MPNPKILCLLAATILLAAILTMQVTRKEEQLDSSEGFSASSASSRTARSAAEKSNDEKSLQPTKSDNFRIRDGTQPIVTASGLEYTVMREGQGSQPGPSDTVMVHYFGVTEEGEEFDSSYSRGEPASFPLNRLIKGWSEGLQLMKVGSKFHFRIPPELAYGEKGTPPKIGPNATLIFEVELLEIVSAKGE